MSTQNSEWNGSWVKPTAKSFHHFFLRGKEWDENMSTVVSLFPNTHQLNQTTLITTSTDMQLSSASLLVQTGDHSYSTSIQQTNQ